MAKTDDVLKQFGRRVRQLRKERGYSQEAFAAECGLDRTYMGGIERGERNVGLKNIQSVAKALSITLEELFQSL